MRLSAAKRISSESIQPELAPAVDVIAGILNTFMQDVVTAINGNIDFENLSFRLVNVEVMVDKDGNLKTPSDVNLALNRLPSGCMCVNVKMTNKSQMLDITGTPFVAFNTVEAGKVRISKVLNLKENKKYILTLLFI